MKRMKRHKIKREKPETSTSYSREKEEHDLAYYIHDRVELMHQVFSALKPKELKAMAPECVRHISIDDLQELCTEELLGISSKRLCAILDGAEPPSDTESSSQSPSPEQMETISLDSISSDDEILSQTSSKKNKKHKHRRRDSKTKHKKKKEREPKERDGEEGEEGERSRASRAGLTVLELLELQARARAIRAQLQQEQNQRQPSESAAPELGHQSSDNEVEIKEEPAEVVEISSEDEKPNIKDLHIEQPSTSKETKNKESTHTVTKKNNLVITVPQAKPSRKIKLNRTKASAPAPKAAQKNVDTVVIAENTTKKVVPVEKIAQNSAQKVNKANAETSKAAIAITKVKSKKKKKEKKRTSTDKEGSDHDEITLQLSDTEKMDLLEDFDRKNYDRVSSSSSEDSESSSSDTDSNSTQEVNTFVKDELLDKKDDFKKMTKENNLVKTTELAYKTESNIDGETREELLSLNKKSTQNPIEITKDKTSEVVTNADEVSKIIEEDSQKTNTENNEIPTKDNNNDKAKGHCLTTEVQTVVDTDKVHVVTTDDTPVVDDVIIAPHPTEISKVGDGTEVIPKNIEVINENTEVITKNTEVITENAEMITKNTELLATDDSSMKQNVLNTGDAHCEPNNGDTEHANTTITMDKDQKTGKELSDGELTSHESSEVEAFDLLPEVVCISDEESGNKSKKKKKNKKKEKKSKKEKKAKKNNSDFRESADQNFYRDAVASEDTVQIEIIDEKPSESEYTEKIDKKTETIDLITLEDDEVYELSDGSSCYEVEGVSVLSKEPTAEEIEALSAKIDEIEREEVVTDEQIREYEEVEEKDNDGDGVENISWKDRYLDSKKVKKVLTTSNILNALRKKNKELKKKMEESKIKEAEVEEESEKVEENVDINLEGSIEHYKMLEGSTKYVDPVQDPMDKDTDNDLVMVEKPIQVTKEMRKDAKQLLKMYKKLLKYNDMNKQKEPNKKKKKKHKKNKDKGKDSQSDSVATLQVTSNK